MKTTILIVLLYIVSSCCPVRVSADYDTKIDFSKYKTYAFYKTGIDKVEISDLDKKRILHAIETQLETKGFTKSETPDVLVNFTTKAQQQVNTTAYNGWSWGWGYGPFNFGYQNSYNSYVEGILTLEFIDSKSKDLVWQGIGSTALTQDVQKKETIINTTVTKILSQYPPIKN